MEKVSVVIPTYNRADLICEAVDSVLKQTYLNIELIVVDDGSTDHTLEVLNKYGDSIQIIAQENKGCSAARNRGIQSCTGKYIAFLDSDDTWLPHKVETQISLLKQAGEEVPCCWCNLLVEVNGNVRDRLSIDRLRPRHSTGLWLNPLGILSTRFILFNQSIMIRRDALEKVGLFDESLWVMEDYDYAIRLALLGRWAYTKEPLVHCYDRAHNRISEQAYQDTAQYLKSCIQIYNKLSYQDTNFDRKSRNHFKLNRFLCILEQKTFSCTDNSLHRIIRNRLVRLFLRFSKIIYNRLVLLYRMKTVPFSASFPGK